MRCISVEQLPTVGIEGQPHFCNAAAVLGGRAPRRTSPGRNAALRVVRRQHEERQGTARRAGMMIMSKLDDARRDERVQTRTSDNARGGDSCDFPTKMNGDYYWSLTLLRTEFAPDHSRHRRVEEASFPSRGQLRFLRQKSKPDPVEARSQLRHSCRMHLSMRERWDTDVSPCVVVLKVPTPYLHRTDDEAGRSGEREIHPHP
ncbi:hypothetical protein PsYK624_006340 [Phanerochaete sordida]|uniref:Uncharacterized protein n=1 Tax=Phanerochaete sordida TaxID=48140 RepID=A0A9P3FWU3_9APHY|nr:hypothetical protein PsYK624_006340 [Phanerochaete sordida]